MTDLDGMGSIEAELAKLEADLFAAVPVRRDAIVRLLDTRYDNLPTPVRRVEISSGFVHGLDPKGKPWRWLSCPDCLTNDRTMFGCETCGGSGRVPDPGRDPMAKTEVVAYGADGSRHDQTYSRDRQIENLAQQLRPASEIDELADANAKGYGWEEARRSMYRRFDYAALDRALEQLHLARPNANPYTEASLLFLDGRMPETIRVPGAEPSAEQVRGPVRAEAGAATLARRDDAMRKAADDGANVADLVSRFGVSKSTVYAVVNRRDAAA